MRVEQAYQPPSSDAPLKQENIRQSAFLTILYISLFIERTIYWAWRALILYFAYQQLTDENSQELFDSELVFALMSFLPVFYLLGGVLSYKVKDYSLLLPVGFCFLSICSIVSIFIDPLLAVVPAVILCCGRGLISPIQSALLGKCYFGNFKNSLAVFAGENLVINIAALIAALAFGLLSDMIGVAATFAVLAALAMVPVIIYYLYRPTFQFNALNEEPEQDSRILNRNFLLPAFSVIFFASLLADFFWSPSIMPKTSLTSQLGVPEAAFSSIPLLATLTGFVFIIIFRGLLNKWFLSCLWTCTGVASFFLVLSLIDSLQLSSSAHFVVLWLIAFGLIESLVFPFLTALICMSGKSRLLPLLMAMAGATYGLSTLIFDSVTAFSQPGNLIYMLAFVGCFALSLWWLSRTIRVGQSGGAA